MGDEEIEEGEVRIPRQNGGGRQQRLQRPADAGKVVEFKQAIASGPEHDEGQDQRQAAQMQGQGVGRIPLVGNEIPDMERNVEQQQHRGQRVANDVRETRALPQTAPAEGESLTTAMMTRDTQ